jgi:serine/threonine-protein kinase HipA
MAQREIEVYAHWKGLKNPALMGVLKATLARGNEIFSFEYSKDWLNSGSSQFLDPDLQLFSGQQYLPEKKANFGIFLDSSPDRWGRLLMLRREAAIARAEGKKEKLYESGYLLGVYDQCRMGALRFKEDKSGPFLNDNKNMAIPPWTSLRDLEHASLELEKDDITDDPDYLMWLNMLLAPGSSLGGARPKANVLDKHNHLWIAKFPSRHDNRDIGAWEMVVNELAKRVGINIAEGSVQKFSGQNHTFLSKRFDRTTDGERIHFSSAMTLFGYTDGADFHDGASYLEFAEFLMKNGANVRNDLEEVWKRIVFSICVKNTDDHLRNHGFLLTEDGWVLSPAYDLNPVETGTGLKLNISENDNSLDLGLALDVAPYFRVDIDKANQIISTVKKEVKGWRILAEKYKIPKAEQEMMSNAFLPE